MPFPSGRCKTCRARHLKCDERRPLCSPCQKSNKHCQWDDVDHSSLVFRDENHFASNLAKRQRGGARRPTPVVHNTTVSTGGPSVHVISMVLTAQEQERTASNTMRKRKPPKLPMMLSTPESLLEHAHAKFTRTYLHPDGHLASDIWGFVHRYRHDFLPHGAHACFNAAFNALTLKFYGQTMQYEPAQDQASEWYSLALLHTRQAICDESTAREDEVLMTCLLLASYEDTSAKLHSADISPPGYTHLQGAASLVHLRQIQRYGSKRGQELDRVVARRVVRQAIYRGACVPKDVEDLMLEDAPAVDVALDTYLGKVADLRSHTLDTISNFRSLDPSLQKLSAQPLLDLVRSALELDRQLRVWYKNIPRSWTYQERWLSDEEYNSCLPSGLLYHRFVHQYESDGDHSGLDGAVSLNRYRAARIITLSTITRIVADPTMRFYVDALQTPILPHHTSQDPTASAPSDILFRYIRSTIYNLTDDICASIPRFFTISNASQLPSSMDEIVEKAAASKVVQLVWPLVIVSATRTCPDAQRNYVKNIIGMIAKITGGVTLGKVATTDLHLNTAPIIQTEIKAQTDRVT